MVRHVVVIVGVALGLMAPRSLAAQAPAAPAAIIQYGLSITPENAKKVAAAAIAEAQKSNLRMAVAVVDAGGYLVYFERMPDTQIGSVEPAIDKARSAALFRRPTKFFQDALGATGDGVRFLGLAGVVPVDGGVPLIVDGKLVGAVGASGGNSVQDGQVATAGAAGVPR
jgi:glc operon protein GlcG